MLFGSKNDSLTLLGIRRELVQDIIEQEILYWKLDARNTQDNLYGEADTKYYWSPIRLTCLIKTGEQNWTDAVYGSDMGRIHTFAFIKEDLEDAGFRADVGDIVEWHKEYFEIDKIKENQFWLGKDENYRLDERLVQRYGESVSIVCTGHLARYTKLNIIARD
jgi:hypothetical protein